MRPLCLAVGEEAQGVGLRRSAPGRILAVTGGVEVDQATDALGRELRGSCGLAAAERPAGQVGSGDAQMVEELPQVSASLAASDLRDRSRVFA